MQNRARTHHPGFESLPLLTFCVVMLLVAMLHPLHITLDHGVLPTGTPTVVVPQHLLHDLVLQLGELVQDQQGAGVTDHQDDQDDGGG